MEFTKDWFSRNLSSWKRHLLPSREKPLRCLEIGSFEGRSAMWMINNVLVHPQSTLYCVDPFEYEPLDDALYSHIPAIAEEIEAARNRFLRNTEEARKERRIIHIPETSAKALPAITGHFDFIYIDGSHYGSDVMTDAVLSWLVLREGGILAFDDYRWNAPSDAAHPEIARPKPAIDCWLKLWECQYKRLASRRSQVWIQRTVANRVLREALKSG